MTLSDKLEKLLALSKAATFSPWTNRMQDGICNKYVDEHAIVVGSEERDRMSRENIDAIIAWRAWIEPLVAVASAAANPDLKLGNEELDGAESIRWYAASKALTHALAALDSLEMK